MVGSETILVSFVMYFMVMASLGKARLALFAFFACMFNDVCVFSDCFGPVFVKSLARSRVRPLPALGFVNCPPSDSSSRPLAVADLALHAFLRQLATVSGTKRIEGRRFRLSWFLFGPSAMQLLLY